MPSNKSSMATPTKQLHIVALTTMTPSKVTEPGRSRKISVGKAPLRQQALASHFRLVLYYRKADERETAAAVAASIKESLGWVLSDRPELAGRLRREHEGDGYWEVKFNDAGVRLVQAAAETSMAELLGSGDRDAAEASLAYWVDVDLDSPELSALFYIQVTEFQGDGYSIGFSCSFLLADPLSLLQFLKSWSLAHIKMLTLGQLSNPLMFHMDNFRTKPTRLNSTPLLLPTPNPTTATILFKLPPALHSRPRAALCVEEAARRLGAAPATGFTLIATDHFGDLTVEHCTPKVSAKPDSSYDGALDVAYWWDELGAAELVFGNIDNVPVRVSYRIVSAGGEGLAVAMRASGDGEDGEGLMVSVTVPKKI